MAHGKQSFAFLDMQLCTLPTLVVTDFHSCGWPIVGTNFSEWVQVFQKNLFWGEPILGGSKSNVTGSLIVFCWYCGYYCCN